MYRLAFAQNAVVSFLAFVVWFSTREGWSLLIAIVSAAGAIAYYRWNWPLKDIYIQNDTVHASSFRRTITFPLSIVTGIEVPGISLRGSYLQLKEPTPFGYRVYFIPGGTSTRGRYLPIEQTLERIRLLSRRS